MSDVDINAIKKVFKNIQDAYPHLKMEIDEDADDVDLDMDIPVQEGIKFEINMNLQFDELHLLAENLWLQWFPCTEEKIIDQYVDAVNGLLSGRYRIFECYQGKRAVRAELQAPKDNGWETIGAWSTWSIPCFKYKKTKVLINR